MRHKDFKFGVEIESCLPPERYFNGIIHLQDGWLAKTEHCGSEVISPPLVGWRGIMQVRRQLQAIWDKTTAIQFNACGLHMHIEFINETLGQLKHLMLMACRFDQVIYCLMHGNRWNNRYCKRYTIPESKIVSARDFISLQLLVKDRYYGLNIHALTKHGTVEFRYAHGTCDWDTVYGLLCLYIAMVDCARGRKELPIIDIVASYTADNPVLNKPIDDLIQLYRNKDIVFDYLELRPRARKILDKMFDKNVLSTRKTLSKANMTENKKARS